MDENCEKWILNCIQEKYEKNVKKALMAKNDVIESAQKYYEDEVEKLHNEAIKEWSQSFHEFVMMANWWFQMAFILGGRNPVLGQP